MPPKGSPPRKAMTLAMAMGAAGGGGPNRGNTERPRATTFHAANGPETSRRYSAHVAETSGSRMATSGPSFAESRKATSGPSFAESRMGTSGPSFAESRMNTSGPSFAESRMNTSGPSFVDQRERDSRTVTQTYTSDFFGGRSTSPPPSTRRTASPSLRTTAPTWTGTASPSMRSTGPPLSMRTASPPPTMRTASPSMRSTGPPLSMRTASPPPTMRTASPPPSMRAASPSLRSTTPHTVLSRGPTGELVATRRVRQRPMDAVSKGTQLAVPMVPRTTFGHGPQRRGLLNGAHYADMNQYLTDNAEDPDRQEHDEMLADTLHKRRPSDVPHPLLSSPKLPMRSAFTDRANRIREGRHMKKTLMASPRAEADRFGHVERLDPPGPPSDKRSAGAASHEVSTNKTIRLVRDSPLEAVEVSPEFESTQMVECLGNKKERGPQDEKEFRSSLGRRSCSPRSPKRSSGMLLHRSMSADNIEAAGWYNQDPLGTSSSTGRARQPFQGSAKDLAAPRSGVAMVLSPRQSDPPVPTRLMTVNKCDGTFKQGPSRTAVYHTTSHNPQVFRFADEVVHGRNSPSPDYEALAGVTSKGAAERYHRQHPASPKLSPRPLLSGVGAVAASVMNHEIGEELCAREASRRAEMDVPFSNLCSITADHLHVQRALAQEVKYFCGNRSDNVARELAWDGAEE